jgi:hypothetical protein
MDPLAIGCIVGFLLVGGALIAGCARSRGSGGKPKMSKSPSGDHLVNLEEVVHERPRETDPVSF